MGQGALDQGSPEFLTTEAWWTSSTCLSYQRWTPQWCHTTWWQPREYWIQGVWLGLKAEVHTPGCEVPHGARQSQRQGEKKTHWEKGPPECQGQVQAPGKGDWGSQRTGIVPADNNWKEQRLTLDFVPIMASRAVGQVLTRCDCCCLSDEADVMAESKRGRKI